jgi:hypothetical protein
MLLLVISPFVYHHALQQQFEESICFSPRLNTHFVYAIPDIAPDIEAMK